MELIDSAHTLEQLIAFCYHTADSKGEFPIRHKYTLVVNNRHKKSPTKVKLRIKWLLENEFLKKDGNGHYYVDDDLFLTLWLNILSLYWYHKPKWKGHIAKLLCMFIKSDYFTHCRKKNWCEEDKRRMLGLYEATFNILKEYYSIPVFTPHL